MADDPEVLLDAGSGWTPVWLERILAAPALAVTLSGVLCEHAPRHDADPRPWLARLIGRRYRDQAVRRVEVTLLEPLAAKPGRGSTRRP